MKKLSVSITKTEGVWGLVYFIFQLIALPIVLVAISHMLPTPLSEVQLNFVFFALNFIFVTVILHRFLIGNLKCALSAPKRCLQAAGAGMGFYWISSYVVGIIIILLYPDFANVNDDSIAGLAQDNFALMAVGTVLLAPITEEALFRGVIFGGLYKKSPIAAYCVSILGFSALHVVGYIGQYEPMHLLLCLLQYIPASFCLCWAYVRADSIWAPILIHTLNNTIAILSMR